MYLNFNDVPTAEIDQAIAWLNQVKKDCDHKIISLVQIKNERERSKRWRDDLNKIALEFCDLDALHLDKETRQKIIKQRLGCDDNRAYQLAEIVTSWANTQRRKQRDNIIYLQFKTGLKPDKIAQKHKISRQQVYNIVKKQDPKMIK